MSVFLLVSNWDRLGLLRATSKKGEREHYCDTRIRHCTARQPGQRRPSVLDREGRKVVNEERAYTTGNVETDASGCKEDTPSSENLAL